MDELTGQNVVVTGGSRGLGRALGAALARAGARVVLVARELGPLATAVAEIRAAGGDAHAVVADVADRDAAHAIAGQAAALLGPIDILINNASTLGPVPLRLLLDTDCEELERALAVNLVGPFRLTEGALCEIPPQHPVLHFFALRGRELIHPRRALGFLSPRQVHRRTRPRWCHRPGSSPAHRSAWISMARTCEPC